MPLRKDWATLADRLEWLVVHYNHRFGLSERTFSEKAGQSRSAVGVAIRRLRKGGDTGYKLLRGVQAYTAVHWDWLMEGRGEPFVEQGPVRLVTPLPQSGERDSDNLKLNPTK